MGYEISSVSRMHSVFNRKTIGLSLLLLQLLKREQNKNIYKLIETKNQSRAIMNTAKPNLVISVAEIRPVPSDTRTCEVLRKKQTNTCT